MDKEKAIEILSDELKHTKQHMEFRGKAPEYYQEMADIAEALQMAIDALKTATVHIDHVNTLNIQ